MNSNQTPTKGRFGLPKDQQRFALLLLIVAVVLIAVVLGGRTPPHDLGTSLTQIEHRVRARHRTQALGRVEAACKQTDCACITTAARAGLDADAGKEVLKLLERAKDCQRESLGGLRAEALVRARETDAGERSAREVLGTKPEEPYALCAAALAAYRQGRLTEATATAKRALVAGRGDGARLLSGLLAYERADLERAREAFGEVLKSEPNDIDALYNLALVAQKQDRYGESRKLYLRVLKLNPKRKDARYNLGILSHSVGADAEARHHLEKLREIAPGDPLIANLEAALAIPPAHPPAHVLKLGAEPPPGAPSR